MDFEELFNAMLEEVTTEEEIQAIIDLYDEQQAQWKEVEEAAEYLLQFAQTEEDIEYLVTMVEEEGPEIEEDIIFETPDLSPEEIESLPVWYDYTGEPHEVEEGRPYQADAELRTDFETLYEAEAYINEIGGVTGGFEVYEVGPKFYVWYVP